LLLVAFLIVCYRELTFVDFARCEVQDDVNNGNIFQLSLCPAVFHLHIHTQPVVKSISVERHLTDETARTCFSYNEIAKRHEFHSTLFKFFLLYAASLHELKQKINRTH